MSGIVEVPAARLLRRMETVAAIDRHDVAAVWSSPWCADLFSQPRQLPGAARFPALRGFAVAEGGPYRECCPLRAFSILHAGLRESLINRFSSAC